MDDIIKAAGMSSSAVYSYVRSKEEFIDAAAEESAGQLDTILAGLLAEDPPPGPAQAITAIVAELRSRSERADYDVSALILQTWAEALRRPELNAAARRFREATRAKLTELAEAWMRSGYLDPAADPESVALLLDILIPGLIIEHLFGAAPDAEVLVRGLTSFQVAPEPLAGQRRRRGREEAQPSVRERL